MRFIPFAFWLFTTSLGADEPAGERRQLVDRLRVLKPRITLDGMPAPPPSSSASGFLLIASGAGPQVAVLIPRAELIASVRPGEVVTVSIPVLGLAGAYRVTARVSLFGGAPAEIALSIDDETPRFRVIPEGSQEIEVDRIARPEEFVIHITTHQAGPLRRPGESPHGTDR